MNISILNLFNPAFKTVVVCTTLLLSTFISLNAQLATWTFEPDPGTTAPASVATNATADNATFGSGVDNIGFVAGNGAGTEAYTGNTWNTAGLAADRYLDFTITAAAGFTLNVSSISFDLERSNTGPQIFGVIIADNTDFSPNRFYSGSNNSALASSDYESFSFTDPFAGEVIKVRIYAWGATSSFGTLRFDNVVIDGTVSEIVVVDPIPTMSQWGLLILGMILTSLAVLKIRKTTLAVS